jgi:hypothetical protein
MGGQANDRLRQVGDPPEHRARRLGREQALAEDAIEF